MTEPASGHGAKTTFGSDRERPPRHLVEAAETSYEEGKNVLDEFTSKVAYLLANGWSDFEAVTDAYRTLREQEPSWALTLGAIAIVRLAKTPAPPLGESADQP